jgi:hypothetical protein
MVAAPARQVGKGKFSRQLERAVRADGRSPLRRQRRDGTEGDGEIVSNIHIAYCKFFDNNCSGISNQRFTGRIQILYNHFEGTSVHDIYMQTDGESGTDAEPGMLWVSKDDSAAWKPFF